MDSQDPKFTPLKSWYPNTAPLALTNRQYQMMVLRANGYSSKEIAWRLGIATSTVKNHFRDVYNRLDVCCAEEAYIKLGWMVAPEPNPGEER